MSMRSFYTSEGGCVWVGGGGYKDISIWMNTRKSSPFVLLLLILVSRPSLL